MAGTASTAGWPRPREQWTRLGWTRAAQVAARSVRAGNQAPEVWAVFVERMQRHGIDPYDFAWDVTLADPDW